MNLPANMRITAFGQDLQLEVNDRAFGKSDYKALFATLPAAIRERLIGWRHVAGKVSA